MLDDVRPPSIPRPNPYPPLTAETWLTDWVYEFDLDTSILTGYMEATKQQADTLEKLLQTAATFDELKSELINFIKERRTFLKDVNDKWDGDNPEQWGFPSHSP